MVKIQIAKWQGSVIPVRAHEPVRVVGFYGAIHENLVQTDFSHIEARVTAYAAEHGLEAVMQVDDELVFEPIAACTCFSGTVKRWIGHCPAHPQPDPADDPF